MDCSKTTKIAFFAGFRIGIPLAFSLAALLVLLGFSLWLPFGYWQWGVVDLTGGWGWAIWGSALIAFLALQYLSKPAPAGATGWLSLVLILVIVFGVANLVLTSFLAEAVAFSELDPSRFAVAVRMAGAVLTFVGLVALIRFILTRF